MNPDYTLDTPKEELLAEILRLRAYQEEWGLLIDNLRAMIDARKVLCLRAVDVLEEFAPGLHKLIAELREAGK